MGFREFFTSQTWWGKVIGAFLGYLIAGSTGAIFGIFIGNFFDRGLAEHFSRPHWAYHAEKRLLVQQVFFESTFCVLGYLAKADGRVSEVEIEMAKNLMKEMGLNRKQQVQAQLYFNMGKKSDFNLQIYMNKLNQTVRDNPALLKLFVDIQYRAAQIDGLSIKKQYIMNTVLSALGFAPLNKQYRFYEDFIYQKNYQHYSSSNHQQSSYKTSSGSSLEHAYGILELSPNAGKQDVKRSYRRLMSRNHPDKLIAKGGSEEMIKIANEKTQKIRKAYEQICLNKGW